MAYRDPTFNANILTDLLSTYLTHKSGEREKYYKVEQQANKPQIRQGADGYLYYVNQNRLGERVLPDVQKPPKTSGQGLTTEEFYFKGGNNEQISGGKKGESLLLQKKGGQYFYSDTGKPVDPSLFANLTKKAPSTNNLKGPKNLKTAFYPDGSNREFDQRIFTDKDGNKKEVYFWLDTGKPVLNTEWANFTLQKDDRDEKTRKLTRIALKNFINKELRPIYNAFSDQNNFALGEKWARYPEMLAKEAQWIRNNFEGDTEVYTSIKAMKDAVPGLAKRSENEIRQQVQAQFDLSVSTGVKPKFILHEKAFGNESDFSTMMENFRNLGK
tara:strand:+ start:6734 stop:7717 length:984 start_codon:yes stop_codon:yes gene_type:complete